MFSEVSDLDAAERLCRLRSFSSSFLLIWTHLRSFTSSSLLIPPLPPPFLSPFLSTGLLPTFTSGVAVSLALTSLGPVFALATASSDFGTKNTLCVRMRFAIDFFRVGRRRSHHNVSLQPHTPSSLSFTSIP